MSLKGALVLAPLVGVAMVQDFDKATGLFYVLPPVGEGSWISIHDFTVLWVGDIVQFLTQAGVETLGWVTHLDFEDWSIEVMTQEGEYGYPLSSNVVCVVGRDMPYLTESQQGRVSASLIRLFVNGLKMVGRIPAIVGGR